MYPLGMEPVQFGFQIIMILIQPLRRQAKKMVTGAERADPIVEIASEFEYCFIVHNFQPFALTRAAQGTTIRNQNLQILPHSMMPGQSIPRKLSTFVCPKMAAKMRLA
jgi:hypothetical protein